ncbi:STAS/SEC14 domain-containing protein [Pseudoponticoccus marisrubri]|uniref:STAS/SEC14 domain-containing protein n=1 Tax=Pseudoponticoccus marisrubri TaxID=1685382 RepID=A0A0W7WHK5_9RHOB|nr:STAS/SEC14 domain-containing protein [Pseudoponticoccus marisrubri]KUF10123.1 hypothetical protein AVJ23_13800 [Pseudoponticoccus marisrubri]
MIEISPMPAPSSYEVRLSGRIREDDYEDVLIPALDRAIEEHEHIRVLVILADDAEFSVGAMLDDAEFGLRHWRGFDRAAVVGRNGWMMRLVRGFAPLMPCPVQTFGPDQADEARRWLGQSLGTIHQTDLGGGVLHVQLRGKLDPARMEEEERDLDAFIRRNDRFRLLLDLREFDGWQGLAAIGQHLRMVRAHYDRLDRAAIVGDAGWQRMGQRLLDTFSAAETRYFEADRFDAAKSWIAA